MAAQRHSAIETEKQEKLWTKIPVPPAVAGQTEIEWEFRAVGDEFSAWVNGHCIASARHTRVRRGTVAFTSDLGLEITKVETIDFGSGIAPALSPPASPAPPPWVPVALTLDAVSKQLDTSLNAEGELTTGRNFTLRGITACAIAFRAEIHLLPGRNSAIQLRRAGFHSYRQLAVYPTDARIQIPGPDKFPTLSLLTYPPGMVPVGKWVPVEFATVGKMSFATVQSLPFPPDISEEALESGEISFGSAQLRKMEIMILDGVPEAQWPGFVRAGMKQTQPDAARPASAVGNTP